MNTEPEVVGTHHGVNLYPIPNLPRYFISKCGKIYSVGSGRWKATHLFRGHLRVSIYDQGKQRVFMVHRLMGVTFLSVENLEVDHINRVKTDNRLENLRVASRAQNARNYLGKGVYHCRGRWAARVGHDGRMIHCGTYDTEHDARAAYIQAKLELGHIGG